jgi:uncharacterized membrane protein YdbT with pleckstrin-like domain
MGYAERILQPGEQIVYRATLHWIIYLPGVLSIVGASASAIYGATLLDKVAHYGFLAIGAAVGAAGLFSVLRAWFRSVNTEIIVSTRRIIYKSGFISRNTTEMNLSKVESVRVHQGIFGRIFDFGTLIIRGVGAGIEPVASVAAPLDFHRYVHANEM